MSDSAFPDGFLICGTGFMGGGLTKIEYASIHIACALIAAGAVGDVTGRAKELAADMLSDQ